MRLNSDAQLLLMLRIQFGNFMADTLLVDETRDVNKRKVVTEHFQLSTHCAKIYQKTPQKQT
jgi:hypothetical protein